MIDIRRVRADPEEVRAALARRRDDSVLAELTELTAADVAQRTIVAERDELRGKVKALSKQVGDLRRAGDTDAAERIQSVSRELGERQGQLGAVAEETGERVRQLLLRIPNIPSAEAPDGDGPSANVEVRRVGPDPSSFGEHQRVPHWEVGSELGILDLERAVKLSGSMFTMFRGLGATLSRALCQLALDRNSDAYEEIRPPSVVLTETMVSTGHLPKFSDDAYHLERDDLWAIPTAEVPLTSLARDEVLAGDELPLRLMAYSPCFRREAGSAGRDTRGLLRVHEFDKVEILAYCTPEQAAEIHAEILARAESLLVELGLTYRVLDLCAGDLGASAARTFDLEVYAPGTDQWLECSSVSWFGDYQARRANIRYRPAPGESLAPVHTLNGSALAVPRVWAALVETHRQPDGSISLPGALHPYLRGATSIGKTG